MNEHPDFTRSQSFKRFLGKWHAFWIDTTTLIFWSMGNVLSRAVVVRIKAILKGRSIVPFHQMAVKRVDQIQVAGTTQLTAKIVFCSIAREDMLLGREVDRIGVVWATVMKSVNIGTVQALFPVETSFVKGWYWLATTVRVKVAVTTWREQLGDINAGFGWIVKVKLKHCQNHLWTRSSAMFDLLKPLCSGLRLF